MSRCGVAVQDKAIVLIIKIVRRLLRTGSSAASHRSSAPWNLPNSASTGWPRLNGGFHAHPGPSFQRLG